MIDGFLITKLVAFWLFGFSTLISIINPFGIAFVFHDMTRWLTPRERSRRLGAGLGFPLARLLAQLHDGHLRAQRRIGGGLAVELRLPIVDADTPPPRGARASAIGWHRPAWVGVLGDVLLLAALFAGAITLSANIFSRFILPSYVDSAAALIAGEVKGMRAAYAALPTSLKPAYDNALRRYSEGRVQFANPAPGTVIGSPLMPTFKELVRHLRQRLPGVPLMVSPWPRSTLWVGPAGDERVPWISARGRPFSSEIWPVLGALGLLTVACAGFLVLRARRRLARLAQDVAQSPVQWQRHASTLGADDGMVRQALELKRRFDALSENLAQAKDDQELLLRNLTSD